MRAIDLHAHLTPQCFQKEVLQGNIWHGMTVDEGELRNPRNAWTPEQRVAEMDSLGVDIQVVSTNVAFYKYDQEVSLTTAIGVDCNNEVHQMTMDYPNRLSGLATLPMQDVNAAIAELERSVTKLGLIGTTPSATWSTGPLHSGPSCSAGSWTNVRTSKSAWPTAVGTHASASGEWTVLGRYARMLRSTSNRPPALI